MYVDLYDIEEELKVAKKLLKSVGSDGKVFLKNIKTAETLLNKAKIAEAKSDFAQVDELVAKIRELVG